MMKKILIVHLLFICSFTDAQTLIVNIDATCVTFNPLYKKAYAAVLADDSSYSNSLLQLDPYNGAVEKHLPLSGEPSSIELTPDNKQLYLSFRYLPQILKIDLEEFQIVETIDIGDFKVMDFEILPTNKNVLLVIRGEDGNPRNLVMYKDGILQSKQISTGIKSPSAICIKNDGSMLYAHNGITSGHEGYLMNIVDDGIEYDGVIWYSMIPSFGDIKIHDDLIYDPMGSVVDAFSESVPILRAMMPVYKLMDYFVTGYEYSEIHGCYLFAHEYFNGNVYISFFHGQYFNYLGSIYTGIWSGAVHDLDVVDEHHFIMITYDSYKGKSSIVFYNNPSRNLIFLKSESTNSEPASNKWSGR
jgi:hypothetical protein